MKHLITIFTPTYNREKLLIRLYNSLLCLKYPFFEWIVVDDGSTDETQQLIQGFVNEGKIEIQYHKQNNAGKHIAINKGVELANGKLFFIVDSDDYLPEDSLNIVIEKYKKVRDNKNIAGVVGKRKIINKEIKNIQLHQSEVISNFFDFRYKYNYSGDMAEIIKLDVLKKYKFPENTSEKFCTEALIWNRISKNYQVLFFDEFIYNCEYQEGGLTSKYWQLLLNNPKNSLLYFKELLTHPLNQNQKKQIIKAFNNISKYNGYSSLYVLKELGFKKFLNIYL